MEILRILEQLVERNEALYETAGKLQTAYEQKDDSAAESYQQEIDQELFELERSYHQVDAWRVQVGVSGIGAYMDRLDAATQERFATCKQRLLEAEKKARIQLITNKKLMEQKLTFTEHLFELTAGLNGSAYQQNEARIINETF
ncbi:hypothetical protein [Listeria costaricensis]|uniref:hypothetical protein n=1 Tax=Listeria costaricensis TaxID=2026604 RepID=UPI000C06D1F7|nr:hypothetical protein [Listeria costaricensis]